VLESPQAKAVLRTLVERLADAPPVRVGEYFMGAAADLLLHDRNGDLVRAAIWATVSVDEPWVVAALSAITLRAFTNSAGYIESQKVPNAAIFALDRLGAVRELSMLDSPHSGQRRRKRIAAALTDAGAAQGLSPSQVLERTVDDGGLDENGTCEARSPPARR
jgi:hypothetical protein